MEIGDSPDSPVAETTHPLESPRNTGHSEDTKEAILSIKGCVTRAIESEDFSLFSNSSPVSRTGVGTWFESMPFIRHRSHDAATTSLTAFCCESSSISVSLPFLISQGRLRDCMP